MYRMEATILVISHYLSIKTVAKFKKHNIIDTKYIEEYTYCFEYLFDLVLYNTSLILLGCISHDVIGSFIYILCMSALKSVAGGVHANKRYICSILSYSLYFIVLLLYKLIYINYSFTKDHNLLYIEILYFIISLIIIILSPIGNANKVFSKNERKKMKCRTVALLTLITIIFFSFRFSTINQYCFLIILCLYVTMSSQIIGIFTNKINNERRL